MKKLLIFTFVLVWQFTFLFAQADIKARFPLTYANIAEKAAKKWPGDFVMQKHAIDEQCIAFNEFANLMSTYNSVPKDVFGQISIDALAKWSDNPWKSCAENNESADAKSACYSADWVMIVATIKKQVEAYNSITSTTTEEQITTFKDLRDGKVYKTVEIGTQTWFAENLAYKVSSGCWAYNDDQGNAAIYGYLYDWETAKNVCPSGWHLPSDAEWTTLTTFLGGETVAGGKLKESGTSHWQSPNFDADNIRRFTGLPGGSRSSSGVFSFIGSTGFWWSTSEFHDYVWSRVLSHKDAISHRINYSQQKGQSIRCIKD